MVDKKIKLFKDLCERQERALTYVYDSPADIVKVAEKIVKYTQKLVFPADPIGIWDMLIKFTDQVNEV